MGVDTSRDRLVAVTNISSDGRTLLIPSFYAFVDSNVPHIWLLLDACTKFEEVFGLVCDNAMDIYLVADTVHEQLLRSNANIALSLVASLSTIVKSDSFTVDIILPYSALEMVAAYSLAPTADINATSRYFPLRRAFDSSKHTVKQCELLDFNSSASSTYSGK
jgi:hypothetical protein